MKQFLMTVVVLLTVISLLGCTQESQQRTSEKEHALNKEDIDALMFADNFRMFAYLGLKYSIAPSTIEAIANEYMAARDLLYGVMSSEKEWQGMKPVTIASATDLVRNIGTKHGIDTKVLASLLVEYEVWVAANNCSLRE
ncbi:MAG: hypothetical protein HZA00_15430 [Nitrospinae bacterium]|nr:hypothetical protein [Nitrospinota bacterium]